MSEHTKECAKKGTYFTLVGKNNFEVREYISRKQHKRQFQSLQILQFHFFLVMVCQTRVVWGIL